MSALNNSVRPERFSRGKRPQFYTTKGMDEAMSMILVLAQEISVLRDRLDAVERVAAKHGLPFAQEIESLELDQEALESREQQRQQLFERLYYLVLKDAHELSTADSQQRYHQVITETAQA